LCALEPGSDQRYLAYNQGNMALAIRTLIALGLLGWVSVALAAPVVAQCELAEIYRSDQKLGTWFGETVAVSGETLVIAARIDHTLHVYEFNQGQFIPRQILTGAGGFALDLSAEFLVSGDPFSGGFNQGRVLIYTTGPQGWTLAQTLTISAAPSGYAFGYSIALDGTRLAVGAIGDAVGAPGTGAVHVFQHTGLGFAHQQKLTATQPLEMDRFGSSVALRGKILVVGAPEQDLPGFNSGAAYVFEDSAGLFAQTAWLEAPDAAHAAVFGFRVSLAGDWLAVSAPGAAYLPSPSEGALYLYQRTPAGFDFRQKLGPPPGTGVGIFGREATFTPGGDTLAVLSSRSAYGAPLCGAVYLLNAGPSGFDYADVAYASDGNPSNGFGVQGLDASEQLLVVGARQDSDLGGEQGSAYVYTLRAGGGTLYYGTSTAGSGGLAPLLTRSGCPTLGQDARFLISQGLGGAPGALLLSTQADAAPLLGGTLLLVPQFPALLHQLGGQPNVAGAGAIEIDLTVPGNPALVGLQLFFQALYADPGASGGFSFTRGLRLTLAQHLLGL
jgi:FG-GAP repeat